MRPPQQSTSELESAERLAALMEPCAIYFRAILVNDDTESDANYSWGPQVDTMDVCGTWVGNDYRIAAQTVGTTESTGAPAVYDMARDGAYQNGTLYTAQQGSIVASQQAGSTLFDAFDATSAQVQASYDDPYYAVAATGGCPNGCMFSVVGGGGPPDHAGPRDTLYRRHGIARRGVRALVESMDDNGQSPEGFRRFRRRMGTTEQTILVHPTQHLLMGEDFKDDNVEIKARHHWKPTSFGFGRERTDIEIKERGGGRVRSRMTQIITNLQVAPRTANP